MREERRRHPRVQWVSPGKIDLGDGQPGKACLVHDLSNGGARLTYVQTDTLPENFKLCLVPGRGASRECRVVWRSKRAIGVEFLEPFPAIPSGEKKGQPAKEHMAQPVQ